MLVVIRDGKELSPKASFVAQLFELSSNTRFLYVFRREEEKFREKWHYDKIQLATSPSGTLMHFILLALKPKDLHDEIIRRLFRRDLSSTVKRNFLYVLSHALGHYFVRSTRTARIIRILRKLNSPRIFLIDEYFSLRLVDLKRLKKLGTIIYVSSDLAYDFFGDNYVASRLMYKLERDAIPLIDMVIACSERDKLKYVEMGARKVIFYPNIYPVEEFELCNKDQMPSMSIVLRDYWDFRALRSLQEAFKALSRINRKIRLYMIGIRPQGVPKNIELQYYDYLPSKLDFLKTLSKSWIGINLGIHMGGTNQRKYDYAMAELVVFSDNLGARGDLLPYEYTYVDNHDLAAKLKQLLKLGKEKIVKMGVENRKQAISLAEKQREELLRMVKSMALYNR